MSEPEESLAAPDSTTREQRVGFSHGDDVLQHRDGKYYLGTVVEVRTSLYFSLAVFNIDAIDCNNADIISRWTWRGRDVLSNFWTTHLPFHRLKSWQNWLCQTRMLCVFFAKNLSLRLTMTLLFATNVAVAITKGVIRCASKYLFDISDK